MNPDRTKLWDCVFVAFFFQIGITQYGAETMTVTSAKEVLATLESFQPNILVSDIGMSDVDGYSLIQQIRALY